MLPRATGGWLLRGTADQAVADLQSLLHPSVQKKPVTLSLPVARF